MRSRSDWNILRHDNGEMRIIDLDAGRVSVTNDIENVVYDLLNSGPLRPGERLFYYDSMGSLDEILIEGGKFAGFAPGPH